MLQNLKLYLGITDNSKDDILNLLLSMAQDDIKGYCFLDEFPQELNNACIKLAAVYYKKKDNEGYSYNGQGSRNVSVLNTIPNDIQNMISSFRRIRVGGR